MRISTFFYTLKQGIRNIFRNGWYSLASVATISACLLLFGTFFSIVANVVHVVKTAEEGVAVTVFFDEGLSDDQIARIGEEISKREEVREINFVSADEAWESFKADLGEYAEGITENPLADSANYEIYLRSIEDQNSLVDYLEAKEGIREVNRSDLTANILTGMNSLIGYIAIAIIAILLAVSVFLISNTVMIGISMRKEEITIMKYIGATDFFVRAPFVVEGVIIGLIGSSIPLGLIYLLYNYIIDFITVNFKILSDILHFVSIDVIFYYLVPISLIVGAGIGFFGSFSTVRKHLRV
ncbi:MAG: permease-like cell division protein FtsX [Lachnospiraceae bacterium]|nr:permease-like cell division protein FtsX [Lachnospiraceae bacterium]